MPDNTSDCHPKDSFKEEGLQELTIHIRPDLYRAFRRCVWMTIHETGLSPTEVHNMLIEELLKSQGC